MGMMESGVSGVFLQVADVGVALSNPPEVCTQLTSARRLA